MVCVRGGPLHSPSHRGGAWEPVRGYRSPGPGTMIARISANRWIGQVVLGRGTTMQGVLSSP